MNKKALLACLLAVMMLLSGCSLIVKDAEVDEQTPIITVLDKVHTKKEVQAATQEQLSYMASMYAQFGMSYDTTSAAAIESAQEAVIAGLIENDVVLAKMEELGFGTLTDEEQAAADAEWAAAWEEHSEMVKALLLGSNPDLAGEELDAQTEWGIAYLYGISREGIARDKKLANMRAALLKDVTVTDEEVKADFDAKVEAAKASYAANLSAYGYALRQGQKVYYTPAGYRRVRSILIQADAADKAAADALKAKGEEQKAVAAAKLALINALAEGADVDVAAMAALVNVPVVETAADVATGTDLTAAPAAEVVFAAGEVTDTLPADLDATVAQLIREYQTALVLQGAYEKAAEEKNATAFVKAAEAAKAVLAKLAEGADWDAVSAERNDDPGMQAGAADAQNGYLVCQNYTYMDSAYVAAAMALANVGDYTTEAVRSDAYGYFIIKYVGDEAEGAVDMAAVAEEIRATLLTSAQDAAYDAMVEKWVAEANAKIDRNALKN